MSSAFVVQRVAKELVEAEVRATGACRHSAVESVARRLRLATGSFRNIIRARVKRIAAETRDRIVAAGIADINRQIERLEHERQILLQMGSNPLADDMDIVDRALAQARAAVERMRGGR